MKNEMGLWIDHRKAVIVTITGRKAEITQVTSDLAKHERHSGDGQEDGPEDQRQRRFTGHLNQYYDKVIAAIRGSESIFIFGPGEAKGELEERLGKEGLAGRIVGIETVDKMTDRQVAAKVRLRFLKSKRKLHDRAV